MLRKQSVVIMPVATDELEKELEDAINRRSDLRFYMKRKWNEKGDILISNGDKDLQNWAYCANQVISNMGEMSFTMVQTKVIQNWIVCLTKSFVSKEKLRNMKLQISLLNIHH